MSCEGTHRALPELMGLSLETTIVELDNNWGLHGEEPRAVLREEWDPAGMRLEVGLWAPRK